MRDCHGANNAKPAAVAGSLLLIKDAKSKLRDVGDIATSPEAIESRIRLCNLLLYEIRDIRTSLERGLHLKQLSLRASRRLRSAMN